LRQERKKLNKRRMKMGLTKKEELEKTIAVARNELSDIICEENIENNKKLIGKCFKYQNCYSHTEKESDYWWLYSKVLSVDKYGDCIIDQFQTDKDGQQTFIPEKTDYINRSNNTNYIEIPESEFIEAWNLFVKKINLSKQED